MLGVGSISCRDALTQNLFRLETEQMQWLLGFVSGAATLAKALKPDDTRFLRVLEQQSNQDIVVWARNWCTSNPTRDLGAAGSHYIGQKSAYGR